MVKEHFQDRQSEENTKLLTDWLIESITAINGTILSNLYA